MRTAIRKNFADFLAILGVVVLGIGVGAYILSNQRLRFPLIEDKPYTVSAELLGRAGGHARAGPDRRRGRCSRGRHRQGGPRGRQGSRGAPARAEVPRPPDAGRQRAAARQDGHQGHVHRARPGRGQAAPGRRPDQRLQHAAGRGPRRVPRRARRRHARLPEAPDLRRRQGSRRPRHRPARGAQAPRAAAQGPRAREQGRGRAPPQHAPAREPLRPPDGGAGEERQGHHAARAQLERHARRLRRRGPEHLRAGVEAARHARPDRHDAGQGGHAREADGTDLRVAAPAVPQAGRGQRRGAAVREGGGADPPEEGAPVRPRGAAVPAQPRRGVEGPRRSRA